MCRCEDEQPHGGERTGSPKSAKEEHLAKLTEAQARMFTGALLRRRDDRPRGRVAAADRGLGRLRRRERRLQHRRGSRQAAHIRANPQVSVTVVDPQDPYRWISVSGPAELTEGGRCRAHQPALAQVLGRDYDLPAGQQRLIVRSQARARDRLRAGLICARMRAALATVLLLVARRLRRRRLAVARRMGRAGERDLPRDAEEGRGAGPPSTSDDYLRVTPKANELGRDGDRAPARPEGAGRDRGATPSEMIDGYEDVDEAAGDRLPGA